MKATFLNLDIMYTKLIVLKCVTLGSVKWEDLLAPLDIQSDYNKFSSRFSSAINEFVTFETPMQTEKESIYDMRSIALEKQEV